MRRINKNIWSPQSRNVAANFAAVFKGWHYISLWKRLRRPGMGRKPQNLITKKPKSKNLYKYFTRAIVLQVFENL